MSVHPRRAQQSLSPHPGNCRIEQAAVADHPAVVLAQRLGIIRRQTLLSTEHCQRTAAPHEWVLDIRKHHDTRAVQRPKRWRQINARHVFKARKTGGDIAALIIDTRAPSACSIPAHHRWWRCRPSQYR